MNRKEFENNILNYYEILENDFINTFRYVELSEKNFDTYSLEFSRLLKDICSYTEIIIRMILQNNLNKFHNLIELLIETKDIQLENRNIVMKKYLEYTLIPYKREVVKNERTNKEEKRLFWWDYYNRSKHDINTFIINSTQKNVLYALAGLYMVIDLYSCILFTKSNESDLVTSKMFKTGYTKKNSNFEDMIEVIDDELDKYIKYD